MREPRALQHARKIRHDAHTATGNSRAILSVVNVAGTEQASTAADRGQARVPDERREFAVEDFITDAKFAKTVEVITEIKPAAGALVAKNGNASLAVESVARVLRGKRIRGDEEVGHRDRLVKLRGGQV